MTAHTQVFYSLCTAVIDKSKSSSRTTHRMHRTGDHAAQKITRAYRTHSSHRSSSYGPPPAPRRSHLFTSVFLRMAFGGGGGGGGGCLGGSSSSATFFERFGVSSRFGVDRSVGGSDSSTTPWVGGGGAGSVSVGEMRPTSALSFSISLRKRSFSSLSLCSSAFGRIIIGELRVDDEPRDDGGGGFVPLACLTGVAITVVVGLSGDGSGIPFFACCRAAATNGSLLPPPADGCCDLGGGVRSVLAKSLSIARSGPSRLGG